MLVQLVWKSTGPAAEFRSKHSCARKHKLHAFCQLQGQPLQLQFKARYGQPLHSCTVQQATAPLAFQPTQLSRYPGSAGSGAANDTGSQLVVTFQRPMRAITPGQVT